MKRALLPGPSTEPWIKILKTRCSNRTAEVIGTCETDWWVWGGEGCAVFFVFLFFHPM